MNNDNSAKSTERTLSRGEMLVMLIPAMIMLFAGLCMMLGAIFISESTAKGSLPSESEASSLTSQLETEPPSVSAGISTELSECFIIREDESGCVSVYLSSGELYKKLDVLAFSLPMRDRERLKVGIVARNEDELYSYIEGFSG